MGQDADGNYYITGYFNGNLTWGNYTIHNNTQRSVFLAKFSPAGQVLWLKKIMEYNHSGGTRFPADQIAVTESGTVYISGAFFNQLALTDTVLNAQPSRTQPVVVQYDSSGTMQWAHTWPLSNNAFIDGTIADENGLYFTGPLVANTTFGGHAVNTSNGKILVGKINPAGGVQWATSYGRLETYGERGIEVALGPDSSLYVGGFQGLSSTATNHAAVLMKLDGVTGQKVWEREWVGPYVSEVSQIAVSSTGRVFAAGTYNGDSIRIGHQVLQNTATVPEIFLMELDTAGTVQWAMSMGSTRQDNTTELAVAHDGEPVLMGLFGINGPVNPPSTFSVGNQSVTGYGGPDIFLVKVQGQSLEKWVQINDPQPQELWYADSTYTIRWSDLNVDRVQVSYSFDTSQGWTNILSPTVAQELTWQVPSTASNQLWVRTMDADNATIGDTVLVDLYQPRTLTLTAPTGGEALTKGEVYNITWSATNVQEVRLELATMNIGNFQVIADNIDATQGSYSWTVPGPPTITAWVRVVDANDNQLADTSGSFEIQNSVGLTDEPADEDFMLYPNPSSSTVFIRLPESHSGPATLRLTDLQGRLVQRHVLEAGQLEFSVAHLPAGTYLLHVEELGEIQPQLLIKR